MGIIMLAISGCKDNTSNTKNQLHNFANIKAGKIEESKYINGAVGLEVEFPEGWKIYSEEYSARLLRIIDQLKPETLEEAFNEGKISNYPLVLATEKETGGNNTTIGIVAMKDTRTPEEFYKAMINAGKSFTDRTLSAGEIHEVTLNGSTFLNMKTTVSQKDLLGYQDQYVHDAGDFLIVVTASYSSDEEKNLIDKTIDSIKIKE